MGEVLKSFGIEGHILLWQVINFFVLFLFLWKFLYKPIGKAMKAREEAVQAGLEKADRLERESRKKDEELKKTMARQRADLEAMYARAREEEKRLKAQMQADMEKEAAKILEEARRSAEDERRAVISAAESEVRQIAAFVAGKILEREVDAKIDKQLMEEAIRSVGKK